MVNSPSASPHTRSTGTVTSSSRPVEHVGVELRALLSPAVPRAGTPVPSSPTAPRRRARTLEASVCWGPSAPSWSRSASSRLAGKRLTPGFSTCTGPPFTATSRATRWGCSTAYRKEIHAPIELPTRIARSSAQHESITAATPATSCGTRIGPLGGFALPVARQIGHHHPVLGGQRCDHPRPGAGLIAGAVQQHQGRPAATLPHRHRARRAVRSDGSPARCGRGPTGSSRRPPSSVSSTPASRPPSSAPRSPALRRTPPASATTSLWASSSPPIKNRKSKTPDTYPTHLGWAGGNLQSSIFNLQFAVPRFIRPRSLNYGIRNAAAAWL